LNNLQTLAGNWNRTYKLGISGALNVPVRAGRTYFIRVDDVYPTWHNPIIPPSNITLTLEPATNGPRAEILLSLLKQTRISHTLIPVPFSLVLMPDGSPVQDPAFRAQLYAGTNAATLSAVGPAQPFWDPTGLYPSGYLGVPWPVPVVLPNIKAYSPVFVQVRAWDSNAGGSFEAARAAGGLTGKSNVLRLIAGSKDSGAASLAGIRSFSLHTPN
jgi:hypothetical protein